MALTPVVARDGNNAAQSMGAWQDPNGYNIPYVSLDSTKATYRVSATFTPQATAAVTVIAVTGSATKTVRIVRIAMGGYGTALSNSVFALQRTSALGAGGTTVSPTVGKMDTGFSAATGVVSHFTTTLKAAGTAVGGPLSTALIGTGTVTTPATAWLGGLQYLFPELGAPIGSAIVLRGAADYLEVQNIAPANLAAGTVLQYFVEWQEDAS